MEKQVSIENLKVFLECLNKHFVKQQAGYGLSSNDFEDKYKERVKSIEPNAEKNVITGINIDGDDLVVTPNRKAVIEVVTDEDVKEIFGDAQKDIGGSTGFEVATDEEIYSILNS